MIALAVLIRPFSGAAEPDSSKAGKAGEKKSASRSSNLRGEVDDGTESPCVKELVLYENPNATPDTYNSVLKQSVAIDVSVVVE